MAETTRATSALVACVSPMQILSRKIAPSAALGAWLNTPARCESHVKCMLTLRLLMRLMRQSNLLAGIARNTSAIGQEVSTAFLALTRPRHISPDPEANVNSCPWTCSPLWKTPSPRVNRVSFAGDKSYTLTYTGSGRGLLPAPLYPDMESTVACTCYL